MKILSCEEIKNFVKNGGKLIDVRTQPEFEQARLPGSVRMSAHELTTPPFSPDDQVYLYCRTGSRSGVAEHFLRDMGYNVTNIGGVVHYLSCLQY